MNNNRIFTGPQAVPECVGLTEEDAINFIQQSGCFHHIGGRDGVEFAMSASYCPSRIVITVKEDVVTKATQG